MNSIRSALFIPGNRRNMLDKAFTVMADAIVPDMEDSVPDRDKDDARATIHEFLPKLRAVEAMVVPRVNALETGIAEDDLAAVVGPYIDGISIGKIRSPSDISEVSLIISKLEDAAGIEPGSIRLIPWVETASAIVRCYEICAASRRVVAVAFGAEDFTNDMGIDRLEDETQLNYPRSALCIAARAAGVAALDTPYFKFRDLDGLREDSLRAKHIGFKGRFAIHPMQVDGINECFSPTAADIEQARRIVAAFEKAEASGRGSTSLDGMVIDVPVVKRARAVLDRAKR